MLPACTMCEIRCRADRIAGERAPCGLGVDTRCFKRHISFAEETELLPSYMVYLGGCNFRCRFCVQAPRCFDPHGGVPVIPGESSRDFARIVERGARTINLLGGEPSLHLHTLLEIAAAAEVPLPLVLNSNMYMTPEVLALLDGVVTAYIADFKFGNDDCAQNLASVHRYVEVVTRNLLLVHGRADLFVRHLVMPGHGVCCLEPVARWLAAQLPGAKVSLMTGYVPAWRACGGGGPMNRCLQPEEIEHARSLATRHGFSTDAA